LNEYIKKKNCSHPLSFNVESRRLKAHKKNLTMLRGLKTKLGSSKHGQGKTFCVWPPTYGTESRSPRAKLFFFQPCMELQAQSLEAQSTAHANFLVVSFLLSKLRIGCQEQKYTYY
jgi:hypothetical protein